MYPLLAMATLLCLSWLPLTSSFCAWAGSNPYWVGAPNVEQVTLTSVRVSWHGLLRREDCADSLIIKHYKGTNTGEYFMSEPQEVSTNSYIVQDLLPNQAYTYQVIAREEKGLLGVDYNRSPKTIFTTHKKNAYINKNDPLPTTIGSDEDNAATENPIDYTGVAPIYGYEPKTMVAGIQLEHFMGIVVGTLVVSIIGVGVIYNLVKKKGGEKDLELDSSIGFEDDEDEDEEGEEDGEDEYEDDAKEARKYDMMINNNKNLAPPTYETSLNSDTWN